MKLQVVKTVRIPVHYAITRRKLSILDSLTARTTYGVWLWSKLFKEHKLKGTYTDRHQFYDEVKAEAKLGTMTQCCFDTAAWMWWSYREAHKAWRRNVAVARREGEWKWLRKLLRREPQEPFTNGLQGKVPIWFDNRFGTIEQSKRIKLCSYVARISTLRRGEKLTIPLNPAKYHLDLLEQGTVKSFQLVKRDGKYSVHVKVESAVPTQPVYAVRGIDLGVKRSVASVMLRPKQPLRSSDFSTIAEGTDLTYKTAKEYLAYLQKIGFVQATRKLGNAQAYRFNMNHMNGLIQFGRQYQNERNNT